MGGCELPDVCAWNPTRVFWKSSKCSLVLSRFSRLHDEFPFEEKFLLFKLVFVFYWTVSRLQNIDAVCSVVHVLLQLACSRSQGQV